MTDAALDTALPVRSRGAVALVLIALAMGGFAIGVTEFAAMSILPDFAAGLGVDAPTAGHVISAYAAGVVVGAPILAVLGARLPRWHLLIGFMALFAVGNVLSALAPTYHWMLVFRFLSGLPHGAYFGVAALVAASIVPLHFRTRAVSTILMGLTVGTVLGVPVVNIISHAYGWRWTFAIVGVLAVITMALVALFAPRDPAHADASPWRELGALKRGQVWLTLGVGAVGFGGMFAVYAYLASTLQAVTGVGAEVLPWVQGGGRPFAVERCGSGPLSHGGVESLGRDGRRLPDRWRRRLGLRVEDPPDGCRRRRPDPGGGPEPLGLQHRQRHRPPAGRHGHRRRLRLDLDRLGRRRPVAGRVRHLPGRLADGSGARDGLTSQKNPAKGPRHERSRHRLPRFQL